MTGWGGWRVGVGGLGGWGGGEGGLGWRGGGGGGGGASSYYSVHWLHPTTVQLRNERKKGPRAIRFQMYTTELGRRYTNSTRGSI